MSLHILLDWKGQHWRAKEIIEYKRVVVKGSKNWRNVMTHWKLTMMVFAMLGVFAMGVHGQNSVGMLRKGRVSAHAVVIRARNGFWYLRLNNEESFIETADVVVRLQASSVKNAVVDAAALADEALVAVFKDKGIATVLDTDKKLNMWAPLFDTVKPSLIQEANYIQPSYFEKLKV